MADAWKFVSWLVQPENLKPLMVAAGSIPNRTDIAKGFIKAKKVATTKVAKAAKTTKVAKTVKKAKTAAKAKKAKK